MPVMKSSITISVVMPILNASDWLPETIRLASDSMKRAGISKAEFVLVDDGSTDEIHQTVTELSCAYPVRLLREPHRGRFLARKKGVESARCEYILFIDVRVHLQPNSMTFISDQLNSHPDRQIWNGHVYVAKQGNLIARLGDSITFIGWRRYFAHPKTTSFGLKDFDYYPKGTGCFFVPKNHLLEAIKEFEATTNDLQFSSDDTLLIRILARNYRINLSPQFSCVYYARTSLKQFTLHTYHRGQFFVDGFLRPTTRFYWPIIIFLAGSAALLLAVILMPFVLVPLVIVMALAWIGGTIAMIILGVPLADALAFFILSPVFALCYALGIWRGFLRKLQARFHMIR
jgi:glycosyltransferase involved in cell wall biosynthesis